MTLSGHTEIDRLISAFNAATAAIEQTENMRRQLIADIAHELRTPVTNLRGQLEAAAAGLIDADAELLATLDSEVQLLAQLVEDFQQLAVSDAGQLRLTLEPLPLRATLEAIVVPMAQRASADVHLTIDPRLQVQADAQRMRQVFGNLVENAHRHRTEGLMLTLTAERIGSTARIRFADNGPGIAAADQPHVFERFYRAEKSRNRASGGAGLGLTIAKALIEAMRGEIRLLPGTGAGAVFEIELPLCD
jgi:two-component system sensor histidine kinase BaeS